MNTLHLKYAVEVERTGSITQAAENLYMGQPNLSKAIIELESSLGFRIFDRTAKGAIPTEKGVRFLAYAKNILSQIERMEALADDGNEKNSLSLIFSRSGYIASAAAKLAMTLSPDERLRLTVRETNAVSVISGVASGQFGIGIVRYKLVHEQYFSDYIKDKGLEAVPFWEFDSRVLLSEQAYPAEEYVTYQQLCEMTPIVYGDESIPYLSFGEVRREDKSPAASRAIFVYDRSTALELVSSVPNTYMLTSPAPFSECARYGLTQKKCRIHGERCRDAILTQKGYRMNETDRRFMDILSSIKNEAEFSSPF